MFEEFWDTERLNENAVLLDSSLGFKRNNEREHTCSSYRCMRAIESSRAMLKGHNGSLWAIYKGRQTASTQVLKEKLMWNTDIHLEVFKKLPAELMVKTNCKDNVEDDGSLYMTQLILWDGLHLHIFTPNTDTCWSLYFTSKVKFVRLNKISHSLSISLLVFLKLVLLLEVADDSLKNQLLTALLLNQMRIWPYRHTVHVKTYKL